MRVVKHLGARSTPTADAKVLIAVPTFPGEKLVGIDMSAYFASGDDSAIDQPGEINWYGITIPWSLVFATQMIGAGGTPDLLANVAALDLLYTRYLQDVLDAGSQTWGGDVDLDPETDTDEETHTEELIDSGPIGVFRWFAREVVMTPLAAEGNTVIRFGDAFTARVKAPMSNMGGLCLLGVVRYVATADTNFNVQLDDTTSREAMGLLISGDYTKVNAKVQGDTSSLGDYLRTVLYGGDQYVEADTLKGPAGKAVIKAKFYIDSPMSRLTK